MTDLKAPLRKHLEDGYDETDVQRTWRGVQRRLVSQEENRRSRGRGYWMFVVGGATATVASVLWLTHTRREPAGPLRLSSAIGMHDLSPPALSLGSALESSDIALSDGSHIALTAGTHLDVLENSGSVFMTALRRGKSTFEVEPGGPRRWVIDCGLATVEVVGTGFTIERTDEELEVEVAHGAVMVRGERVPQGAQRLVAGDRIAVRLDVRAAESSPVDLAPSREVLDAGRGAPPAISAPSILPTAPPDAAPAESVDDLLRDADRVRQTGDRRRGADLMDRLVAEGRTDSRASFGAFTLARWMMADDPARAAAALSAMLSAGVPLGLEEDARARLVEAHARAGHGERAREAAADYERHFPRGSRLAEVRRWAER